VSIFARNSSTTDIFAQTERLTIEFSITLESTSKQKLGVIL
jgi:hypothetical protein